MFGTQSKSAARMSGTTCKRILPRGRASQLGAGSFVTLLARMDPLTGHMTVFQIVVHPEDAGPGFPTLAPTPTATPAGVPGTVP